MILFESITLYAHKYPGRRGLAIRLCLLTCNYGAGGVKYRKLISDRWRFWLSPEIYHHCPLEKYSRLIELNLKMINAVIAVFDLN